MSGVVSDTDAGAPIEGASSPGQKEVKTGDGDGPSTDQPIAEALDVLDRITDLGIFFELTA